MKITAKYLTKVYPNGTYALDGFTANIESGEFVVVLGESGCGKTTLLRLFSGLEKPTAGELYFDGVLFRDLPVKQRDTAVVFQEYVLYPKMTVWENVATALERYNLPREEEEKRIYKALCDFGLIKFRNQLPRVLSGGQQQRVALARAVVRNPSLILFDEPLSNVAQEQRAEYVKIIKDLKKRLPAATFIYVTHNPREAMSVGERLLIMGEGRCLQYGEKHRVWKYPYCADVLRTICTELNELEGEIKGGVFTAESGEVLPFEGVDYQGAATVIFNPYNKNVPCIFDKNGNTLSGEREICKFNAEYNGAKVKLCGTEFSADEDFRLRFIGKTGKVFAGVKSVNIRFSPLYGDLKIPAERDGDVFTVAGTQIILYDTQNFDGFLYVSPADIELYDGEKRTLAHYRVYKQSCTARAGGGKLRLKCGVLEYGGADSGYLEVSFNSKAYVTPVKKGGLRADCIAEEDLGGEKLVYCAMKGFSNYVVFRAKPKDKFFTAKKLHISVATAGITVKKPL